MGTESGIACGSWNVVKNVLALTTRNTLYPLKVFEEGMGSGEGGKLFPKSFPPSPAVGDPNKTPAL